MTGMNFSVVGVDNLFELISFNIGRHAVFKRRPVKLLMHQVITSHSLVVEGKSYQVNKDQSSKQKSESNALKFSGSLSFELFSLAYHKLLNITNLS